jgi:hypothetical protein
MPSSRRFVLLFLVQLILFGSLAGPALAAPPPRDDEASRICGDRGFRLVADARGDAFRNERQCLTYVRAGGTLLPVTTEPTMSVSFAPMGGGNCLRTITLSGFTPGTGVPWGLRSWWSNGVDKWHEAPAWDAPHPIAIGTAGSGSQSAISSETSHDTDTGLWTYQQIIAGGLTWGPDKIECP